MGLSLLDNILLNVLSKAQGSNFEEKIDNVKFVFFYSGMTLFFSGVVLILGPSFIGTVLLYFGAKVDLSAIYEAVNNGWIQFFMSFVILGVILFILGFLLGKHLQGIIKRYAYIESTKVEEKEVYNLDSEVNLNIRAETLGGEKTVISAKEPFSNKKLNNFRDKYNKYIFIEVSKEAETKIAYGGKAEILLTNEDEIAKLNIPKEALSYKVEKILLTKKVTQRVCDFLKEETTAFHTKIFLSASPDEDMMKKIKNQKELDALLHL